MTLTIVDLTVAIQNRITYAVSAKDWQDISEMIESIIALKQNEEV